MGYIALTEAVKRCGDCKEVVRAFIVNGWPPDQPQQVMSAALTTSHYLAWVSHFPVSMGQKRVKVISATERLVSSTVTMEWPIVQFL